MEISDAASNAVKVRDAESTAPAPDAGVLDFGPLTIPRAKSAENAPPSAASDGVVRGGFIEHNGPPLAKDVLSNNLLTLARLARRFKELDVNHRLGEILECALPEKEAAHAYRTIRTFHIDEIRLTALELRKLIDERSEGAILNAGNLRKLREILLNSAQLCRSADLVNAALYTVIDKERSLLPRLRDRLRLSGRALDLLREHRARPIFRDFCPERLRDAFEAAALRIAPDHQGDAARCTTANIEHKAFRNLKPARYTCRIDGETLCLEYRHDVATELKIIKPDWLLAYGRTVAIIWENADRNSIDLVELCDLVSPQDGDLLHSWRQSIDHRLTGRVIAGADYWMDICDRALTGLTVLTEDLQSDLGHWMMDVDRLLSGFQVLQHALSGRDHEALWRKYSMKRMLDPRVRHANNLLNGNAADLVHEDSTKYQQLIQAIGSVLGYRDEDRGDSPWVRRSNLNTASYILRQLMNGNGSIFEKEIDAREGLALASFPH